MPAPRQIKVFIASPGDLAVERRAFKDVIDELNKGYGRGAHVEFVPLGWEDALSTVGRRSQAVINQDIDACDVFVLLMWRRWGQEAPDAAPYSSYTEEEFYRALARFEKERKSPCIFVFLKHIDPAQMADPGLQLTKVLAFRRKLEETRKVLYRSFADENAFRKEIDRHLVAYAEGQCDLTDASIGPMMPDSISTEISKHKEEAARAIQELEKLRQEMKRVQEAAEQARAEATDARSRAEAAGMAADARTAVRSLELAEHAAKAALEGKIEEARQEFAKALDGTTNLRVLYLGYEFFSRIGELHEAERLLNRWLAISGRDQQTEETAAALGNLGLITKTRGDLDAAEKLHREALEINCKLGRREGQAKQLGNLGVIAKARGDLDAAEKLHREALEISKLGHLEGQASDLTNLGVIAHIRGDLDAAEKLNREALEIERKLGRREGQASDLGNLGLIAKKRGNIREARQFLTQSRDLYARIGISKMEKQLQDWLDGLPKQE